MGRKDTRDNLSPVADTAGDPLLALLPQSLRIALVMRERAGLSDQAIAAHLKVAASEVPRLIEEARKELLRLRSAQTREDAP